MKLITPEFMNSLTPMLIAIIGGIIGITVIFKAPANENWASGMGLASTAIAGASGLAQSGKSEPTGQNSKPLNQKQEG